MPTVLRRVAPTLAIAFLYAILVGLGARNGVPGILAGCVAAFLIHSYVVWRRSVPTRADQPSN